MLRNAEAVVADLDIISKKTLAVIAAGPKNQLLESSNVPLRSKILPSTAMERRLESLWQDILIVNDGSKKKVGEEESKQETFADSNSLRPDNKDFEGLEPVADLKRIKQWNKELPITSNLTVHSAFKLQVSEHPDSPAICSWDGNLSYSELDDLSNRFASYLCHLGVRPEVLVAICFDKSKWAVVAMLAVLKAGGAFVPLTFQAPTAREKQILRDTKTTVLITSPSKFASDFESVVHTVVQLTTEFDQELQGIVRASTDRHWEEHDDGIPNRDAALIIFTSGSTGTPKGIVQEHAALVTSLIQIGKVMGLDQSSRVLQFSSYTFDLSFCDHFSTLITGGCVCIPSSYQLKNSLAESIRAMKVNVCHLTPTASKLIHPSEVQLQTLVLGGEPVTKNELRVWADNVHLIQAYGPSEAAIFCIGHTSPLKTNSQPNNIGKGISVSVWITDPENHNRLAPIGAIGEILIEGPVLARGYLNNDELTRYSFIEDPLWSVETTPGQRIRRFYKTGDLGSYASDGSIHIVGRKDTQVKIRGQRVELGEIEYQLQQRLGGIEVVAEVVNPAYSNASQKMIVAFLRVGVEEAVEISEPTAATDASIVARDMGSRRRIKELTTGLLRQLGQVLPFYMLPSAFVPTNRMPKTTSGKTDRKILRETATKMSAQELAGFVEDGGSNEESIYSSGYSPTSIFADDNFFNIGGDSISAMRLVSAARRNGILLSVEDVFKHPALRDMASVARIINGKDSIINDIQTFSMAGTQDELKSHVDQAAKQCSVVADMIEDIFPCTPLQSGLMALSVKEPGTYITRAVYKLPELVDADRFKAAWMESSDRHVILRTRIIYTTSHGFMQVVLKPEAFNSWETAESLDLDSYLSENRSSKQMTPGLPLTVLTITQDRHFVWTAHHSTYDGWSMERLLEHVEMAYNSIHISPQQSDFTAFVKFLQDSDVEKTKDFWRSQLAGAIAPSYPTSPTLQYQPLADSSITRAFPVSTKIGTGITAATILRAAWGLTMAKYENVSNIVFGTVLNGRNASVAGIENIMGPTIATVPVRIQIDTTRSLSQFLRAVQEQAVGMIPYQHFGLQNISSLGPDQEQACKFKILLVVQQKAPQTRIAPGQRLGLEKINIRSATFLTYPITMECVLEDGTATINASYDSRAIGSKQMQRMMNHFEHTILQLITANRASSIHDLSSISSADIQDIESWHCDLPLISTETLDSLFRQQVQKQPASQAVCSHDGVLTYAELDDISNRIAGHLVERSEIGVEDTVALCSEKSVWAIASILGILKAGGAYVPIAFQEPTDRERTILQSAKAKVIIASPVHAESFRALGLNVVSLTRSFIQGLHPSPGSFHVDLRKSSNAALVIFTSGSTGTPKGVVQEHSSLVTSLLEIGQRMGLNSQSRALQFAAYTFDLSFCDIMSTLITGGCICSISEEDRTNNLAGFINRFEVNVAHLTPTVSRLLIPSTVPGLKTLVLGGEPLTRAEVTTWADQVHLIQGYGPTEAGVCCVLSQLNIDSHPSNIGKSFSSWMWITLQDNHDQLAPIGAIGEILLEGPILSRGYLGNEALTAASFVENPAFARNNDHSQDKMPPRRFYKTGDLARYNTDGSIQIIGRKDSQIKLRGQRIELGEVEYQVKKLLPADMDVVVEVLSPAQGSLAPTMIAFISIAQRVEKFSLLAPDFPNVLNPSHKSASDEHVA
jgi:amino acid adenylation domain-containing protein